jgi:hypothetical protein
MAFVVARDPNRLSCERNAFLFIYKTASQGAFMSLQVN